MPVTTKTKAPVTLTAQEKKDVQAILDRASGFAKATTRCTPTYWQGVARNLLTEIETATDPEGIDAKVEELRLATERYASTQKGGLRDAKRALKKRDAAVLGEIPAILIPAAEKAAQPLLDQAAAAQLAQNADHDERGIPHAPCPASESLRQQAEDLLRRARSGDITLVSE